MLGFKYFICSLFLWLSFSSPQEFYGASSNIDIKVDSITSSNGNKHQALIVDGYLEINQANWSFKTFKIPFIPINYKVLLSIAESYDFKLLYLEIGKNIPLKLTSSTLIFPFHCFT
ncbi:hypothetical protein ACFSKN_09255 [Mariniflexile gromovii]|uniref:Uncharacterized protein n=1 Tax=Mariniflexile gromovii TaxID=362523 RepID=A0ABS4BTY5_9FLAO|nr:hypothetical protein [Mariniflexile gromovii]MBP0904026.1 hypothetical protein [Mariniflexile gromovii]